jgi:hypothetical protein
VVAAGPGTVAGLRTAAADRRNRPAADKLAGAAGGSIHPAEVGHLEKAQKSKESGTLE